MKLPTKRLSPDELRAWNAKVAAMTPKPPPQKPAPRLTHAELASAHDRQDWDTLWRVAQPLVKLAVGRMARGGSLRGEDTDDDLLQQGMQIAGDAVRSWRPLECAFSTHVMNRVRGDLLNYATVRANGGVGSHMQQPIVLGLGDTRDDARPQSDEDGEEDSGDDGTFEATLTYDGLVKPGGQLAGEIQPPEGFGSPEDEAARLCMEDACARAARVLSPAEQEYLPCLTGKEIQDECAIRLGVSLRTVKRRVQRIRAKLAPFLPNFRHLE